MTEAVCLDRKNIERIAQTPEDRVLLARLWDKITAGMGKNILSCSGFLSPREQEMARFLFGNAEGLSFYGGFPDAQRKCLVYLPDYLSEIPEDDPIVCLRATFYKGDHPSHRDFLGALMGFGIERHCVGDICVGEGYCDFFVLSDIAPHLLRDFESAGRTKVKLSPMPLSEFAQPEEKTESFYDTLPSLRLDALIAAVWRLSRSESQELLERGMVFIGGRLVESPSHTLQEGDLVSVRHKGRFRYEGAVRETKKGRLRVSVRIY
jgi:RNA-binding protein YlmH